jgi:peroxiredoxin
MKPCFILLLLCTGCVTTQVHEISSDRTVITVHAGVPFTPICDGKFVPEARFNEMLDVYIRESWRTKP